MLWLITWMNIYSDLVYIFHTLWEKVRGAGGSGHKHCGSRRSCSEFQRERAGAALRKQSRAGLYNLPFWLAYYRWAENRPPLSRWLWYSVWMSRPERDKKNRWIISWLNFPKYSFANKYNMYAHISVKLAFCRDNNLYISDRWFVEQTGSHIIDFWKNNMLGNHAKAPENKLEDPNWACFSGDVFFWFTALHKHSLYQPI